MALLITTNRIVRLTAHKNMSIGAGWFDLFHKGHISMFRNVLFLSVHHFRMILKKNKQNHPQIQTQTQSQTRQNQTGIKDARKLGRIELND